jgi:organic hydroperoxide reductase OsmC/OhrA
MHPYPHLYTVCADGGATGSVSVNATGLPQIDTAPPVQFDGPGGTWSPETLLYAAVADCFILTFRALARASKCNWSELTCQVEGVLDRVDGIAQFTRFATRATLKLAEGADVNIAHTLLEKAEDRCLIANSLRGTRVLVAKVILASEAGELQRSG